MQKGIFSLWVLLLAGACDTVWYKPGATEAEFNKDEYECRREAMGYGGLVGAGGSSGGIIYGGVSRTGDKGLYHSCLRARGYSTQQ